MFQSGMKESDGAPIIITDSSAASIKQTLEFIYAGVVPDQSSPDVEDLFVVADKYGLDQLNTSCGHVVGKSLTCPHVCEMLVLADMFLPWLEKGLFGVHHKECKG